LKAATDWFRSGNTAYEDGRFEVAAADYQKAVDLGVADARLYYNLGNALFRLNRLGPAILYYERAFKLNPADPDIAFNLRFARARVVDKIPEPETNLLTRALWGLHASYSVRAGAWAAWLLFTLAFAGAAAAQWLRGFARAGVWMATVLAGIALLAFSPSLVYKIRQQESAQYGVVLQPMAEMFSGPGENYQILAKVHEGTKFEIVERKGDWVSVKLANGKGGFVRASQLGMV
jgi:tetratricopeptide (TPR) repeat protein